MNCGDMLSDQGIFPKIRHLKMLLTEIVQNTGCMNDVQPVFLSVHLETLFFDFYFLIFIF